MNIKELLPATCLRPYCCPSLLTGYATATVRIRTAVGGPVGRWQVGTSFPGFGFEALPAALAVLASGVVFTLALEGPVLQQALGGVEVTLTPSNKDKNR